MAKRLGPDKAAGVGLCYESAKGYTGVRGWWTIPKDEKWHENTWKVSDANFVGQWGWNFRFDANGSPNEFLIKEVRVKKPAKGGAKETAFPIKVSDNGRYFIDQKGNPVFWLGTTQWQLFRDHVRPSRDLDHCFRGLPGLGRRAINRAGPPQLFVTAALTPNWGTRI